MYLPLFTHAIHRFYLFIHLSIDDVDVETSIDRDIIDRDMTCMTWGEVLELANTDLCGIDALEAEVVTLGLSEAGGSWKWLLWPANSPILNETREFSRPEKFTFAMEIRNPQRFPRKTIHDCFWSELGNSDLQNQIIQSSKILQDTTFIEDRLHLPSGYLT